MPFSVVMKSHEVLSFPVPPGKRIIPLFCVFSCRYSLPVSSHPGYHLCCSSISELVFKSPSFYLIRAPKHKSSDAGNSDMPKGSCTVTPLSEKVSTEQ